MRLCLGRRLFLARDRSASGVDSLFNVADPDPAKRVNPEGADRDVRPDGLGLSDTEPRRIGKVPDVVGLGKFCGPKDASLLRRRQVERAASTGHRRVAPGQRPISAERLPAGTISRAASRVSRNTPRAFTAWTRSHSSAVPSSSCWPSVVDQAPRSAVLRHDFSPVAHDRSSSPARVQHDKSGHHQGFDEQWRVSLASCGS